MESSILEKQKIPDIVVSKVLQDGALLIIVNALKALIKPADR
jgi:hypothetical protein